MKVRKCPTDELAVTNTAVVNKEDFDANGVKHVQMQTGPGHRYVFTIRNHPSMKSKEIAFAIAQRKWAVLSLDQEVLVAPFSFKSNQYIGSITLSADFQLKKNATSEPLNSDFMAREFSMQFGGMAFAKGQLLVFQFNDTRKGQDLHVIPRREKH
ncbi:cell division protein 48 domain protein [Cooperia oncophora]